jgi:hypothetical protein
MSDYADVTRAKNDHPETHYAKPGDIHGDDALYAARIWNLVTFL